MTVSQLIAELQKLDGDLEVVVGHPVFSGEGARVASVSRGYWVSAGGPSSVYLYETRSDCEDGDRWPAWPWLLGVVIFWAIIWWVVFRG